MKGKVLRFLYFFKIKDLVKFKEIFKLLLSKVVLFGYCFEIMYNFKVILILLYFLIF